MEKKYTLTITEKQTILIKEALEEYFRMLYRHGTI